MKVYTCCALPSRAVTKGLHWRSQWWPNSKLSPWVHVWPHQGVNLWCTKASVAKGRGLCSRRKYSVSESVAGMECLNFATEQTYGPQVWVVSTPWECPVLERAVGRPSRTVSPGLSADCCYSSLRLGISGWGSTCNSDDFAAVVSTDHIKGTEGLCFPEWKVTCNKAEVFLSPA